MLRTTTMRSVVRSFARAPAARSSYTAASRQLRSSSALCQSNSKRPQVLSSLPRPTTISLLYATKSGEPIDKIDSKEERKYAERKLEPHPEEVSTASSVRPAFEGGSAPRIVDDQTPSGVLADIKTVIDTFSLADVPKEPLYLGAAGVLPYAATSLSTVFLAWDINHAKATGSGFLVSPETAHYLLDFVTPIQIGYGAVIISFLGAIHWGLEYAGYGGQHGYRRYMHGVIAPALAWPTIFMPVEYALISQFVAFNILYFSDSRATARGWFPPWYATYRFVLTFFVGASIVLSLIGRGEIVKSDSRLKSPEGYIKEDRDAQWLALEREEIERRQALAKAEEEGEGEEEESEDEDPSEKSSGQSEDKGKEGEKSDDKEDKKGKNNKADDKEDDKKQK